MPQVAQKPVAPTQKTGFDRKKPEKPIDKKEKKPYSVPQDKIADLSMDEQNLLKLLGEGEILADELIAASGIPAGKVLSMLTMLQIKGIVELLPGKRIILKS